MITIDKVLADLREAMQANMNRTTLQLLSAITEDQVKELVPDVEALDAYLEKKLLPFLESDDPTVDILVDGASVVFAMGIFENVIGHFGLMDDSERDAELDAAVDGDDDEEEGDEQA